MSWEDNINYRAVPVNEAKFLVCGRAETKDGCVGGIVATAGDEFTAHRIAKEINKNPDWCVYVEPNTDEALDRAHNLVLDQLNEL